MLQLALVEHAASLSRTLLVADLLVSERGVVEGKGGVHQEVGVRKG